MREDETDRILPRMRIGIVIPCINLWDRYTKPCLESIKTKYDYRVVLVDNASSDKTCEEASKLVSSKFSHKRNQFNWGVQRSWNYGIQDSFDNGCEYVLICNNDILLHPDCIDRLVERFRMAEGNLQYDADTSKLDPKIVMITAMDARGECAYPEKLFDLKSADKGEVGESEGPNFSAYMINRRCWEEVGKFDEGFFPAYFEDNDYHYRIKLAGLKAIVYPPALFFHYGSRTQNESGDIPLVPGSLFEKNRSYFIRKWGGVPGNEAFTHPYNDEDKSIRHTQQDD